MIYQAKVLHLDDDVEEAVTLQIDDVQLICFASVCPYAIEEGMTYPVQLQLVVLGEYDVTEVVEKTGLAFSRGDKGFGYLVHGKLSGSHIEIDGLVFEDDVLQRDFWYLDGKAIVMKVDRIDVEFLNPRVR